MTVNFDTLTYSKNLTKAGEKPEIAEVHALAIKNLVEDELVTKEHLDHKLEAMENRLVIKLGGMIIAATVVLGVLMKIL